MIQMKMKKKLRDLLHPPEMFRRPIGDRHQQLPLQQETEKVVRREDLPLQQAAHRLQETLLVDPMFGVYFLHGALSILCAEECENVASMGNDGVGAETAVSTGVGRDHPTAALLGAILPSASAGLGGAETNMGTACMKGPTG